MTRARLPRAAAILLLFALPVFAGCSQVAGADESFRDDIPAALEAADLGITDAWADVALDGLSETLSVGGTLAEVGDPDRSLLDAAPEEEISDELVQEIIAVALAERSLPMAYFRLTLRDAADERIDIDPALTRLGASVRGDDSITMEDAEQIAEGAAR